MKTILIAILLAFSALCHAADYTGIVAFGDSLTDMGNRWFKAGMDESKIRSTWVKQLAGPTMLNIPGFKVSGMTSYLGGTNYAVGGAGTEATAAMNTERNRGQHLTQQVSKRYLNPTFNTDGVKPDALHVIVIGANDVMLASIGAQQILSQWSGLDNSVVTVAQSTEGQIHALAAAGVKRVLWGNVFDVAQAPSVVKRAQMVGALAPTYLAAVTKAVRAHNAEMDAAIVRLEKAYPTLKITKLDLFTMFIDIAADPAKYGLTDVTTGANDNKHLFSADGLHPSAKGHKILAEYAFAVLSAKANPVTAPAP